MAVTEGDVDALLDAVREDPKRVLLTFGDSKILDNTVDLVRQNLGSRDYAEFLKDLKNRLYQLEPGQSKNSLNTLHASVANCNLCPKAHNPSIPMWNRENPEILIVSKLPIRKDDGTKFLVETMKEVGLDSDTVGATSVARCESEEPKHEQAVFGTCAVNYLYKEISLMAPTVIVTLGSIPFFALFGRKEKVNDVVGNVRHLGGITVVPSYDPSYALRSERRKQDFINHIQTIKSLMRPHDE